jgi:hypothetical protein
MLTVCLVLDNTCQPLNTFAQSFTSQSITRTKKKIFQGLGILQINANKPSHIPYMPWFIINLLKLHQIAHLNENKKSLDWTIYV